MNSLTMCQVINLRLQIWLPAIECISRFDELAEVQEVDNVETS